MPPLNMDAAGETARARFWRSLAEAEGREEVAQPPGLSRREFMKVMGASLALAGTAGCSDQALEKIVPYVHGPDQQTYGEPLYYASVVPHDGYGIGVLVKTNMGRPTKIEGNLLHPASLGATDVFRQAAVLELWDPDRSRTVRSGTRIATWDDLLLALRERLRALGARRGHGLRLLTGTIASPSLHAQIAAILSRYPDARWHQWQPVNRDNVHAGAQLAYGEPLDTVARFDRARVVLAFDGDFLDDNPAFVRYALDFAATRDAFASREARSRLYALECTPTLTGANADHRLPLRGSDMETAAREVAVGLGIAGAASARTLLPKPWLDAVIADLRAHPGAAIVVAGARQPAAVHALVHAINEQLRNYGSTLTHIAPVAEQAVDHLQSLRDLVDGMNDGEVDTLIISGTNALYTAPADVAFATALAKVPLRIHHGLYRDETASACHWHVPAAHPLESWGDLRSYDGTIALQQPCIAPLYQGKTAHELLAAVMGDITGSARDIVRAYWSNTRSGDVDAFFEEALRTGVVADSAHPARRVTARNALAAPTASASSDDEIELVFMPDARIGDGAWANNAWLQELPKPLTLLTWDNAALVSPALARRLGCDNEDVVELRVGARTVSAPLWIVPGLPDRTVNLALGYGRTAAGQVGDGRGANAYQLRTSSSPWFVQGVGNYAYRSPPVARLRADASHHGRPRHRSPVSRRRGGSLYAGAMRNGGPRETDAVRLAAAGAIRLGDDHRPRPASAATPAPSPARPRTTSPSSAATRFARPRDALDPRRPLRRRARGESAHGLPAGAVHAMRARAVRGGVSGRGVDARQRRAQRAGLQPLRRHALLLEQLPVQGASLQLPAVRARRSRRSRRSAIPTSPCACAA